MQAARACVLEQPIFAIDRKRALFLMLPPWFMAPSGVSRNFFFSAVWHVSAAVAKL
jgi:hypothetical protein